MSKIFDISIYLILASIISSFGKYLFLLDFPPEMNIYQISDTFYGKDIPIYGIIKFLILALDQRISLFIILFLSGFSMYALTYNMISSKKIYAGLFYMINPYTYSRILTGQLLVLFSYAIIPFLLKFFLHFLEKQRKKEMIEFIFALSIISFSIHVLIISLIIMVIIFLFWLNKYKEIRITKLFAISGILFILLNAYWIMPVLTAKNTIVDNITDKDYEIYATKDSLFEIAAMYGFWREGYIYTKDILPGWKILYLIILSLTTIGFLAYYKDKKIGYIVKAFTVIGIVGFILASGIKGPFGDQIHWLFDNTILKGFRDSHKFVSMMVLTYAALGGLGMAKLEDIYMRKNYNEEKL